MQANCSTSIIPPHRLSLTCSVCGTIFTVPASRLSKPGGGKYCSRACQGRGQTVDLATRFWAKVDKSGDCWLWTGSTTKQGYGKLTISARKPRGYFRAPTIAYELTYGPIPEGMLVCHSCAINYPRGDITYRRCVNPAHLYAGTDTDNNRDTVRHGRRAIHNNHYLIGEEKPNALLTAKTVKEIRAIRANGGSSLRILSERFHVSSSSISAMLQGRTWKHII
jgi:hypothetical protein